MRKYRRRYHEDTMHGDVYTFPAEWEKHEAIWMSWPIEKESVTGKSSTPVFAEMIAQLLPHVKVSLCVNDNNQREEALHLLASKQVASSTIANLNSRFVPHYDNWIRDFGPIFLTNPTRTAAKLAVFDWNEWGYQDYLDSIDFGTEAKGYGK